MINMEKFTTNNLDGIAASGVDCAAGGVLIDGVNTEAVVECH